jgi:hypothetical protein
VERDGERQGKGGCDGVKQGKVERDGERQRKAERERKETLSRRDLQSHFESLICIISNFQEKKKMEAIVSGAG